MSELLRRVKMIFADLYFDHASPVSNRPSCYLSALPSSNRNAVDKLRSAMQNFEK